MVTITERFSSLKLGELFSKLHSSIIDFARDTSKVSDLNDSINTGTIDELRDHITERLNNNENIDENKALLKTLDLFVTDKAFIRLIKEDSEEWLGFLDAIQESLLRMDHNLSGEDKLEMERIIGRLDELRNLIRKES